MSLKGLKWHSIDLSQQVKSIQADWLDDPIEKLKLVIDIFYGVELCVEGNYASLEFIEAIF
jgi:hypothetical protein